MIKTIFLFVFLISIQGCYFDNADKLYPKEDCKTTEITYSKTIVPIIENNCLNCHNSSSYINSGGGNNLEGYSNIKSFATNGKLINSITSSSPSIRMPLGNARLSDCNIEKVQIWINAGAPNN